MTETPAPAVPARPPLRALLGGVLTLALDAALLAVGVGGAHGLLRHPRAVGLLVVWAAGYGALAALRPPHLRAAAGRRPEQRPLLVLLILVPLVTPMLSAWSERAGLWPMPGGAALRWAGVALAALGFLLRVLAMARLGARFSPVVEVQPGHTLETGGVYALMRHPGYAGACLANLGVVLAFGSWATLPLVAAMALATETRARREERALDAAFGEAWRGYAARIGRWWPRAGR